MTVPFLSDVVSYPFLRNALAAGLLASISCGVVGSYVVARRITSVSGAIAHSVLGGLGAARYCQVVLGWSWFTPFTGAVFAALVSALVIAWVGSVAREREDTAIGAVWALGMAAGLLFISQTPGYSEDLMSYLFGNILMVSHRDLGVMAGLDALVLAIAAAFHRGLVAVSFDEEFASIRGLGVRFHTIVLYCLAAVTVVMLVTVVGIVLVIALLTLPAASASRFTRSLGGMMVLAACLAALVTTSGLALSYEADLSAGPTIILVAGAIYVAFTSAGLFRKRA